MRALKVRGGMLFGGNSSGVRCGDLGDFNLERLSSKEPALGRSQHTSPANGDLE